MAYSYENIRGALLFSDLDEKRVMVQVIVNGHCNETMILDRSREPFGFTKTSEPCRLLRAFSALRVKMMLKRWHRGNT